MVHVLEYRVNDTGQQRVRFDVGWVRALHTIN